MSEDVLFESASLTKSLFGTLVMRLCQEGRVELDRPIMDVLRDEPWSNDPSLFRHHAPALPVPWQRPAQLAGPAHGYAV